MWSKHSKNSFRRLLCSSVDKKLALNFNLWPSFNGTVRIRYLLEANNRWIRHEEGSETKERTPFPNSLQSKIQLKFQIFIAPLSWWLIFLISWIKSFFFVSSLSCFCNPKNPSPFNDNWKSWKKKKYMSIYLILLRFFFAKKNIIMREIAMETKTERRKTNREK